MVEIDVALMCVELCLIQGTQWCLIFCLMVYVRKHTSNFNQLVPLECSRGTHKNMVKRISGLTEKDD